MTDRELLELAAKAAGIEKLLGFGIDSYAPYWINDPKQPEPRYWNPLTDDGDALRLMSSLRLDILWAEHERSVVACNDSSDDSPVAEKVRFTANPAAATRRAIVRAAAEIGSSMKGQK